MNRPHPLVFEPILKPKVWGSRRLTRYAKDLPPGERIGESWEIADLARTNAAGAGGGEARSVIAQGPLVGQTLHDVIDLWGDDIIERARLTPDGAFPLLVKFLDAAENLSVQTHPSSVYAKAHPDAHLKTECWYVCEAEPGARIYAGLREGLSPGDIAAHALDGTIVDDLVARPARKGDMHVLPSGTVHALGAGVLVAEIQTPSDTTFRLYDWGRTDRGLHVDQALEAMILDSAPPPTSITADARTRLADTPFFTVDALHVRGHWRCEQEACTVLMAIEDEGELRAADNAWQPMPMRAGTTVLIPRACAHLATMHGDLTALCVHV